MERLLTRQSALVEVGCGTGKFCMSFIDRVDLIVGVDLSANFLSFLRARWQEHLSNVVLLHGDATALTELLLNAPQLQSDFWNRHRVVTCVMNTLGIMPGSIRQNVLNEMVKALDPVSTFFLVVFNSEFFLQGVNEFYKTVPHLCGTVEDSDITWETAEINVASSGYYAHWFTEDELSKMVQNAGLKDYSIRRVGVALFVIGNNQVA
jgi:SAM-dependent methyltransferase